MSRLARVYVDSNFTRRTENISITNQPIDKDGMPIVFDIDAYLVKEQNPDSPEFWEAFNDLRGLKNRIFFASITDKCRELFE